MTSNTPPKITSLSAGTPSSEWADKTESMLLSNTITTDPAMKAAPKSEEHHTPTTTAINQDTPGHEFPGSYPKELESLEQEQQPLGARGNGSEGSPMASVVHAAKQFMPDNVERTMEYASQRAAAYIPQGIKDTVTSYWSCDQRQGSQGDEVKPPLSTSLPSSETKGNQPFEHVGGVGSLPGTLSESSVALLPDERAARTPVSGDESQTQGKSAAISAASVKTDSFVPSKSPLSQVHSGQDVTQKNSHHAEQASTTKTDERPAGVDKRGSDAEKPLREAPEERRSHVPETAGIAGAAAGAGSATGRTRTDRDAEKLSTSEPAVAPPQPYAAPEGQGSPVAETAATGQRQDTQGQARDLPRGESTAAQPTAGAEVAGGAIGTGGLSKDHEHKQAKPTSQETQETGVQESRGNAQEAGTEGVKHSHTAGAGAGGHDNGYHPAKMHPLPTGNRADEAEAQSDSSVSPPTATTASTTDSPKDRRVSFIQKVRGEAKIIAGKMSGKGG